jgi:hypothetical protein
MRVGIGRRSATVEQGQINHGRSRNSYQVGQSKIPSPLSRQVPGQVQYPPGRAPVSSVMAADSYPNLDRDKQIAELRAEVEDYEKRITQLRIKIRNGEREQQEVQRRVESMAAQKKVAEQERDELRRKLDAEEAAAATSSQAGANKGGKRPAPAATSAEDKAGAKAPKRPARANSADQAAPKPPAPRRRSSGNSDQSSLPPSRDTSDNSSVFRDTSVATQAADDTTKDGITVPSLDEARRAAVDTGLYTPCFLHENFRLRLLDTYRTQPANEPKKPGKVKVCCLVSRSSSAECGYNGFIMWQEVWGRKCSHAVELKLLCYPASDSATATALIEAMIGRFDTQGPGRIDVKMAEKSSTELRTTWQSLGFDGLPDDSTVFREFVR